MGDIEFASKIYLGVRSNIRVATGSAISSYCDTDYRGANHADLCCQINFQVDMGVNMGMYNGVVSRHGI